jgi:hypothetical protein
MSGDPLSDFQDIPSEYHDELHEAIADELDSEFAGEGAPSAYNGGQAAWQQFFANNPGAFEQADALINMVTQDFMEELGLW